MEQEGGHPSGPVNANLWTSNEEPPQKAWVYNPLWPDYVAHRKGRWHAVVCVRRTAIH